MKNLSNISSRTNTPAPDTMTDIANSRSQSPNMPEAQEAPPLPFRENEAVMPVTPPVLSPSEIAVEPAVEPVDPILQLATFAEIRGAHALEDQLANPTVTRPQGFPMDRKGRSK
jgi:hypothetical protein